jgi:hypothetical protein
MIESPYIQLSESIPSLIETERGVLPVRGFHALAGLELIRSPYDPGRPFDFVVPEDWIRRSTRFWVALAAGLHNDEVPWQTSYELRVSRNDETEQSLKISLWAKAFAPQDYVADQAVDMLLEKMAALLPPPCESRPISTRTEFERLWGTGEPQWLAEVRRVVRVNTKDDEARDYELNDWHPSPDGLRDLWELISRLPEDLWFSIGVCPTRPFVSEERALQELFWNESSREKGIWQLWQARLREWSRQAFLVRFRIGGEARTGEWLADALAAVLTDPYELQFDQDGGTSTGSCSTEALLVIPESAQDWQAARFNWQWGDFRIWGEDASPLPLSRLRYLHSAREMGLLAGIWG